MYGYSVENGVEHVTTPGARTLAHARARVKCEHVYAPMSTIKQSPEVVMFGQVETLRVSFISVEWQLGNTPPPLNPNQP